LRVLADHPDLYRIPAGIEIEKADISVSARVLAEFSEFLSDDQKVPNTLASWARSACCRT
jgi:monomeric isocitrate dehydrogenase